jgi:hypothetical protein
VLSRKNPVFWGLVPYNLSCRSFEGMNYLLPFQGLGVNQAVSKQLTISLLTTCFRFHILFRRRAIKFCIQRRYGIHKPVGYSDILAQKDCLYRVQRRAVARAVSSRLPTAAARVRAQFRSCGICGEQSSSGADFLWVLRFPLPSIPLIVPRS